MPDVIVPRVGDALGRYELVEQIGEGGMGVVYRARDVRLKREVAIKVLLSARTEDSQWLASFEREAQAVAALSHPNIVALYDFASDRGIWYAVTELLKGATLRTLLADGPLTIHQALDYAMQMTEGLAAAHDKGIVHQDLKPENILVTADGWVKILDFGVAQMRPIGGADLDDTTTAEPFGDGSAGPVGTVAYMSPEQLHGQAVDHRSDLFSLGTTLYEMLAGRRPFRDGSLADTVSSILRDIPESLTTINPSVSPTLERLVRRCLEKSVLERFQSARDLRFALETIRDPKTVPPRARPSTPPPPGSSIAVLPFRDMSPGGDQDSFCEGLAEEIIIALTKVTGLRVAARTSAFQFKGQARDLRRIGEALHVAAVLDGSVRKSGDRLRITVELLNSADGYHLWSERFDRDVEDVFAVQEEIAGAIVSVLQGRLAAGGQAPLVAPHTKDVEAYLLYLEGRYHWNRRTETELMKSLRSFEQAIGRDPDYAQAYVGTADALVTLGTYGALAAQDVMPRAERAVTRALEIDARLADAYACRACIRSVFDWSWTAAESDFEYAIELNPGYAAARHWYAINLLVPVGRFDEALDQLRKALELDPLSLVIKTSLGMRSYYAGLYEQALDELSKAIELDESFSMARLFRGQTFAAISNWTDARRDLDEAIRLSGRSPEVLAALGYLCGVSGDAAGARSILVELGQLSPGRYVSRSLFAQVHAGLDERAEALDRLEEACAARAADLAWLRVRPAFAKFRSEPRFLALLERLNLSDDGTVAGVPR